MEFNDFELLNLAGFRRKQIIESGEASSCTLVIHHGLENSGKNFADALEALLLWLKPKKCVDHLWGEEERNQALRAFAEKILSPLYQVDPGFMSKAIDAYIEEMPKEDLLFFEYFRLLPFFVRKKHVGSPLNDWINFEINKNLLEARDLILPKMAAQQIIANPSVLVFDHREPLHQFLPENKIYILYTHPLSLAVQAVPLDEEDAFLLDESGEEYPVTEEKLLQEALRTHSDKGEEFWRLRIAGLKEKGLILKGH